MYKLNQIEGALNALVQGKSTSAWRRNDRQVPKVLKTRPSGVPMPFDNRFAELAGWDRDLLRIEMQALAALDPAFDLEITGFETSELDDLLDCSVSEEDPADQQLATDTGPTVSKLGDLWVMGGHRLICANACAAESYVPLMEGERARMVFCDPPFNVKIDDGEVGARSTVARRKTFWP